MGTSVFVVPAFLPCFGFYLNDNRCAVEGSVNMFFLGGPKQPALAGVLVRSAGGLSGNLEHKDCF